MGQRSRIRTWGSVHAWRTASDTSIEARIGAKIRPQPNGCWLYADTACDYPMIRIGPETLKVFRVLYECVVGEIPDGLYLHHECLNKRCVNPWHGLPVTPYEHNYLHAWLDAEAECSASEASS